MSWLKLHRRLLEWCWYDEPNTLRLFLHILLKANFEQKDWHGVTVYPGQLVTGRKILAKELKLTEQEIRTSLTRLKSTNEITIKTTNKYSIVTICKWGSYQAKKEDEQPTEQPAEQPTINQQITTTKEDKKDKNNNQPEIFDGINEELIEVVQDWFEYKKCRKESYKNQKSISAFISKIRNFSNDDPKIARQIITESMANNWSGIFELKVPKTINGYEPERKKELYKPEIW